MLPEKIADHIHAGANSQSFNLRKKAPFRERPICGGQTGIMTGDQRASDDEKERGAGNHQRKTMQTPIHIADCRLPIADLRSKPLSNAFFNPKSEIGKRKSL